MPRSHLQSLAVLVFGILALAVNVSGVSGQETKKPNVIVILADDLGYSDLGIHGGKDVPTPHIDSIARNGVRCTQGYVSCPYCSPTRAGLLTGRYQTRFGHEFNEGGGNRQRFGLPVTETTFAQRMKALGYATAAVGKWHLGFTPDRRPMQRGFDEFYGTLANTPFFRPQLVDSRVGPDPRPVDAPGYYTTDAYADRAVDLIQKFKAAPFFLYLPFNACHVPIQAIPKYLDRFKNIDSMERRGYAAMLSALDDAVGRVLGAVREANLEERTLIVFLSDNGGPMTKMGINGSNNRPLKGQKGDTWEGGVRVPFFVQWQGRLPAGKVYEKPVIQLDLLPTALAAAGSEAKEGVRLDGVNLLPYLEGKSADAPHETLTWRFGPKWAIRKGDWKLVQGYDYDAKDQGPIHEIKVTAVRLFNLAADAGETNDLAEKHPEKVKELRAAWEAWNQEQANPAWIPLPAPAMPKPGKPGKPGKPAAVRPVYRVLGADKGRVAIVGAKGEVEWEYPNKAECHDLHLLPSGNILMATDRATVAEVTPEKKIVWQYEAKPKPGYSGRIEVHAFQRLADGLTMVAESGNARLVEVDREGKIVYQIPLTVDKPHPHRDTRMVRKLDNGHYLVCHEGDGKVREYDPTGKVVWSYTLDLGGRPRTPGHGPEGHGTEVYGAVRLPNGHTLIAGGNNNRVLEVTPEGKVVWSLDQDELPGIKLAWVTTLHVLENGNLLVGNCHAGPDNPQLFEVTRDKKVVWTFKDFQTFGNGLAATHVLGLQGKVIR